MNVYVCTMACYQMRKKNKLFFLFLLNSKCGQLNFDVGPWNNKV